MEEFWNVAEPTAAARYDRAIILLLSPHCYHRFYFSRLKPSNSEECTPLNDRNICFFFCNFIGFVSKMMRQNSNQEFKIPSRTNLNHRVLITGDIFHKMGPEVTILVITNLGHRFRPRACLLSNPKVAPLWRSVSRARLEAWLACCDRRHMKRRRGSQSHLHWAALPLRMRLHEPMVFSKFESEDGLRDTASVPNCRVPGDEFHQPRVFLWCPLLLRKARIKAAKPPLYGLGAFGDSRQMRRSLVMLGYQNDGLRPGVDYPHLETMTANHLCSDREVCDRMGASPDGPGNW
jgi:hypothetical protein